MSPFDMAIFAFPISFFIAILSGWAGMVSLAVTNLAMFSLAQAIIAADAGLVARGVASLKNPSARTAGFYSRRSTDSRE
jgi:hypothetical protein